LFQSLSPSSLILVAGIGWLYLRGLARPRLVGSPLSELRHAGVIAALALWLVTSNGPLAVAAHRLFALHQAEHLGLRLLAPLLFALANPWPALIAGLPRRARRAARWLGRKLDLLRRLPVALALLIAWFYLWQVPGAHNAALASPALTLLAHLGMAVTGVNFFACVLDRRDSPKAHLQAPRVLAVTVVILSNILLGSLTTLKETVIYSGYDLAGRLWDFAPLADETVGGYTIWVPSSMVMIVAILFIITGWNAAEVRRWENRHALMRQSNSAALEFPETAQELRLKVADPNRRVAGALAATSLSIFLVVMATAITIVSLW
jgi:putative membrane protein